MNLNNFFVERADLQSMAENEAEARALFERGRDMLEKMSQQQLGNGELLGPLIYTLARLGERDKASRTLDKYTKLSTGDARAEALVEDTRARVMALFGDQDRAIASVERVLAKPCDNTPLTPALLRLAPDFDSLRGDPRFENLCQDSTK